MAAVPTAREPIPNKLLAALPAQEYARLRRKLTPVKFSLKESVAVPGKPIKNVYFPTRGVLSLLVPMPSGDSMEVAMVGNEGVLGIHAYLGAIRDPLKAICQVPGTGLRMKIGSFLNEVKKRGPLAIVVDRYLEALLIHMAVAGACNRLHTIEQRCARWLLMTQDRVDGAEFVLTQDFLAKMLGIRRGGVNAVAASFKKNGMIRYSRGKMLVLSRAGLETMACECYRMIKDAHECFHSHRRDNHKQG
jgi:CRP-like cAMP-binding protein